MTEGYFDRLPLGDFRAVVSDPTPGAIYGISIIRITYDTYRCEQVSLNLFHIHKVVNQRNYKLCDTK